MAKIGLLRNIYEAALAIDSGRKGFATRGKAEEGRINYEEGIDKALSAFKEAQAYADPETIILAEYAFISQELEFCDKTDKDSLSSLTLAIQSLDDAFLVLKTVEDGNIINPCYVMERNNGKETEYSGFCDALILHLLHAAGSQGYGIYG